ncbi:MAG: hypothetical protein ACJAZS_000311 [Alteromonas naphthalenivorans]|jgi:hypothetical protein
MKKKLLLLTLMFTTLVTPSWAMKTVDTGDYPGFGDASEQQTEPSQTDAAALDRQQKAFTVNKISAEPSQQETGYGFDAKQPVAAPDMSVAQGKIMSSVGVEPSDNLMEHEDQIKTALNEQIEAIDGNAANVGKNYKKRAQLQLEKYHSILDLRNNPEDQDLRDKLLNKEWNMKKYKDINKLEKLKEKNMNKKVGGLVEVASYPVERDDTFQFLYKTPKEKGAIQIAHNEKLKQEFESWKKEYEMKASKNSLDTIKDKIDALNNKADIKGLKHQGFDEPKKELAAFRNYQKENTGKSLYDYTTHIINNIKQPNYKYRNRETLLTENKYNSPQLKQKITDLQIASLARNKTEENDRENPDDDDDDEDSEQWVTGEGQGKSFGTSGSNAFGQKPGRTRVRNGQRVPK